MTQDEYDFSFVDGPLHGAAHTGDVAQLAELLQEANDVNDKGQFGQTPLHRAAMAGQVDSVRILLDAGAEIDHCDNSSKTPLYRAVEGNHVEAVRLLLKRGADKDKSFPLHFSAENGRIELLTILLEAGADADAADCWRSSTPLHLAANKCQPEAVTVLIRFGANLNVRNCNKETPLFLAARRGDDNIAQKLIAAGADVNALNTTGWAPLHTASGQGYDHVVDRLLQAGATLDIRNRYGWTPLFLAAGSGQTSVVRRLLAAGADVQAKDAREVTPLQNARKNGHQEIILLLQEAAGLLPKDFSNENSSETNWQELLWNYPNAIAAYTTDDWQKIVDGLVESFSRFLQVQFVHAEPPSLSLENEFPSVNLNLTCTSPTPYGALNQHVRGGIVVYESDGEKHIDTGISVFLFLDKTRLKAESANAEQQADDCLEYVFVRKEDGTSVWECRGWNSGYYNEWHGIKFPERIAATQRLQVILPDHDDERYDPVTGNIELHLCPFCKQDYIYPWMIRGKLRMIWICGDCEAKWNKHMPFITEAIPGVHFLKDLDVLFPDRPDSFNWYDEIEPLPYQYTHENLSSRDGFPPEASSIYDYGSNCINAFECEMPADIFEKQAVIWQFNMKAIETPIRIPRYNFRPFLQGVSSVQDLKRCFPDLSFIHTATHGRYHDNNKYGCFRRVVYDEQESKLYWYSFRGRCAGYKVVKDSRRLYEMLLELCKAE